MMILPKAVSGGAEQALRRLVALSVRADTTPTDSRDIVISAVSITESYVDRVLRTLVDASGISQVPFALAMFDELRDVVTRSWDERFKWLRKGFGVALSGDAAQQDFQTLVELRNAIVHGEDRFTDRQTRGLPSLVQLERRVYRVLLVEASKDGFLFGPETSGRAVSVARTFVLAIDDAVRRAHPNAHL